MSSQAVPPPYPTGIWPWLDGLPPGRLRHKPLSHNNVSNNSGGNYPSWLTPDVNSISADPLLVNRSAGNFRLHANSPCINAGDDAAVIGATDLDGNARMTGSHVDMGAFEFQPRVPPIIYVAQSASGANDGTSWANAYTSVVAALTVAGHGEEVWVSAGTYTDSIVLPEYVALYGGFAGTETAPLPAVIGRQIQWSWDIWASYTVLSSGLGYAFGWLHRREQ